jgi:hypothetical protein
MTTLHVALRAMQLLPNGLGGVLMASDFLHGMVRKDMVEKLGYPVRLRVAALSHALARIVRSRRPCLTPPRTPVPQAWFPTVLGIFKLVQAVLNWCAGPLGVAASQCMFAYQLGGVVYTHTVVEGRHLLAGNVPALVFGCCGLALQVDNGVLGLLPALAAHSALALAGYSTGFRISFWGSRRGR